VSFLCSTCWNYRCLCEVGGGFPACTILHFSSLKFICFQSRSSEVSPEFLATRPYAHTDRWLSFSRFHVLALELLLQIVLNLLNTVGPSTDSGGISVSCPFLFFLPAFYACEDFISCFKTAWLPYESLLSNSQLPLGSRYQWISLVRVKLSITLSPESVSAVVIVFVTVSVNLPVRMPVLQPAVTRLLRRLR